MVDNIFVAFASYLYVFAFLCRFLIDYPHFFHLCRYFFSKKKNDYFFADSTSFVPRNVLLILAFFSDWYLFFIKYLGCYTYAFVIRFRLWNMTFQCTSLFRLVIIYIRESLSLKWHAWNNCASLCNIVKEQITKTSFINETQG